MSDDLYTAALVFVCYICTSSTSTHSFSIHCTQFEFACTQFEFARTQFEFAHSHYSKYNNETLHSYTNSSLVCVNIDLRHVCNQAVNHNLLLTTATTATTAVCLSVHVVGMCV